MVVEAESAEEARKIAEKLADTGRGEMTMSDTGDASVSDVQAMEAPETADRKQAEENAEAWEELKEEDDSLRVEMDKDGKLIENDND